MPLHTHNTIRLNYGQLHNLMLELGYRAVKTTTGALVYTHRRNNAFFPIRQAKRNEIVPDVVLSAVATNVVNTKVAPEARFRKLAASHAA